MLDQSIELTFYKTELIVQPGKPQTLEVERYLVTENYETGGYLLSWDYLGNRTWQFTLCKQENGMDNGMMVTPWQVLSWAPPETMIYIPQWADFRTIRLADEYELMGAGDPIEFIRMSDMHVLGQAEIISTKRTLIKYLRYEDIQDFQRVVGGRTCVRSIQELLEAYYEQPLTPNTAVIVMQLTATTSIVSSDEAENDMVNTASVGAIIKSTATTPIIRGI
jgi:hypothetical protein